MHYDETENSEQKYQPDGDETLFHDQAQVAPQRAFNRKHQHMSAIQNWDRKEIQDPEVDAEKCHENDVFGKAELRRLHRDLHKPPGPDKSLIETRPENKPPNTHII